MDKSSTGLSANVAGFLCYVLGWITGLIFLLIEKDSKFVRFHAMQSLMVFGALSILIAILSPVPIINIFVYMVALVLWIVLIMKAYQGVKFKLPLVGDLAEKQTS